jgi:hypothetical protein
MDEIRAYILSVGAAGLLCTIAAQLAGKESMAAKAVKLVSGLCMLLTVLKPFGQLRPEEMQKYFDEFSVHADIAVSDGESQTQLALQNSIKEGIASYILDKGAAQGANLTVQVVLDEGFPPKLRTVYLEGEIAPYASRF